MGNNLLKRKKGKKTDGELIFCLLMIALPVIQFIVFYIIVNFNSFLLAFRRFNGDMADVKYSFAGWDNFKTFWIDLTQTTNMRSAIKNSLTTWFFTSVVGITIAVIVSYFIFKKGWLASGFKLVLFLPSILPAILLVAIFQIFVDTIIPEVLNVNPLFVLGEGTAFPAALFFTVWFSFGTQVLLYCGSMAQISPSVLEAAKIDGVSPIIELWKLVIPEILPAISTFLIAGIATIFTNQANLFGFHSTYALEYEGEATLGYWMYAMTQKSEQNYPYVSTVGLCCTAIALPLTFLVKKALAKLGD